MAIRSCQGWKLQRTELVDNIRNDFVTSKEKMHYQMAKRIKGTILKRWERILEAKDSILEIEKEEIKIVIEGFMDLCLNFN